MTITMYWTKHVCVSCRVPMSHDDVYRTHGRCPHCGYRDKSYIAAYDEICVRRETTRRPTGRPWWQFWADKYVFDIVDTEVEEPQRRSTS